MSVVPSIDTLFLGLILILILWFIQFRVKRRRLYKLAAQYNGPRPYPIIGNYFKTPLTEITQKILDGCLYYKSPTRFWFGPKLSVQIWDPENVRIVLNSPHALEKEPHLNRMFEIVAGRGLPTLPVNEWKRHRKLIAPIFNTKNFERFFDVIVIHSMKLVKNIESNVDKGSFDIHELAVKYALNSVSGAILDVTHHEGSTHTNINEMLTWLKSMWIVVTTRMTSVWYFSDFIYKMSALNTTLTQAKAKYDTFMSLFIKQWEENSIKKLKANGCNENEKESIPRRLVDFLPSALEGTGKFTLEELRQESESILAAGFETISSALGFLLILLGMHPKVQEKLFLEITQTIGNKRQLEYEDLKKLMYMERVMKEAWRIFPAIVAVARYSNNEIQLSHHTIPAYTSIIIVLVALHRDPKIWPNPIEFNPDRFVPEEEAKRHPYSYIPFLAGPRNCIAEKYALINIKVVLSLFILNYKVSTSYKNVEDVKLTMISVFKPTNGYNISITSRRT